MENYHNSIEKCAKSWSVNYFCDRFLQNSISFRLKINKIDRLFRTIDLIIIELIIAFSKAVQCKYLEKLLLKTNNRYINKTLKISSFVQQLPKKKL